MTKVLYLVEVFWKNRPLEQSTLVPEREREDAQSAMERLMKMDRVSGVAIHEVTVGEMIDFALKSSNTLPI